MTQTYALNDVYCAVQGEGAMTGQAMALVRLHGCPVGCPFCDTKETWAAEPANEVATLEAALGTNPLWAEVSPEAVRDHLARTAPQMRWVLLTGGEPALQPLGPLVRALRLAGYRVALETSGTADGHLGVPLDWVCCSPKFDMPGGRPVLTRVLATADELKFVIGRESDLARVDACLADLAASDVLVRNHRVVSLQPLSCHPKATRLCVETVKRKGWRLSLQTHKFLDGER